MLTWCGMRGLATLALALSLPTTTADGAGFPARAEIVVIASTVLVATLLLPGFTLPALVRALGVAEDADAEHAAEQVVAQRARRAALARMDEEERAADLPEEVSTALHERMARWRPAARRAGDRGRPRPARGDAPRPGGRAADPELGAGRRPRRGARGPPGAGHRPGGRGPRADRLDLRTVLLD